jgi:peptidoglycan-N-acetylglucosamine deacetylase
MSAPDDRWISPSSDALRARRAELRRRRRRGRRRNALLAGAVATVAVLAALVTSGTAHRVAVPHARQASITPGLPLPRTRTSNLRVVSRHDGSTRELLAGETAAIGRLLARQPFIRWGGSERREVALTFDDGPGPYTPSLLTQLRRLHTPATFFEIGFMIRWFHASLVRELQMGDAIGDHTETHPRMALLSPAAQQQQILAQTEWLHKYGAPFPRLWRPPYGSYDAATLQILRRLHMLMVLWTVDTDDYLRPGVRVIVDRALAGARPGAIILMHDAGGTRTQTIAALPLIVHALRKRGYRFVTIPQLILDDPPLRPQTLPTTLHGD